MTTDPKLEKNEMKKQEKLTKKKAKMEKFQKKQATVGAQTGYNKGAAKSQTGLSTASIEYTEPTKSGDKKNTSIPLPASYSSKYTEACWYSWWEKEGFFKPEYNKKAESEKFVVIMPPPNVTGSLHLGHALMCSIEDVIVPWARMKGKTVLWNPGCDHAGIATHVVVEKKLKKEKNLSRFDIGREQFLKEVMLWKDEKGNRIYEQMKRLGISCDWQRACFTMDQKLNQAVVEAFVRLHEQKLIYRADRLVNWSCALNSVISDIEVDKVDVSGPTNYAVPNYEKKIEFGTMTYFYYEVENSGNKLLIATTRLETMLGDVAVVVNPNDPRYKHLHGGYVIHPFCKRKMPIILDESIDIEFGTGAMKLTPAHDFNDYDLALKHKLDFINILTDEGSILNISDLQPEFKDIFTGLKRFDARKVIAKELEKMGLLDKIVPHSMVLPFCSRSKDIIEPMLKPQWYIDCSMMAEDALNAVKNKELKLIPESFEKTWYNWMGNHRDWCISRQLWWGHRIPAYKCSTDCLNALAAKFPQLKSLNENDHWISAKSLDQAKIKFISKFDLPSDTEIVMIQDDDVLDTWFSSGLFPFSVFGWPDNTEDFEKFYPTSLLETGHDILFFWVARMVMLGKKLTGKLPFNEVLLHALVRDAHGRKMSKSLGNIVDPIDVIEGISLNMLHENLKTYNLSDIEIKKAINSQKADFPNGIPECGADALRFSLCAYTSQGRDINLDILRVQGYRFFCNKIWNAFKFSMSNIDQKNKYSVDKLENINLEALSPSDKWILSRLDYCIEHTDIAISEYKLQQATTLVYNFWLYDLCDVYIELSKSHIKDCETTTIVLLKCVYDGLKLLSPFMPFLTEELYQRLPLTFIDDKCSRSSITVDTFPITRNFYDRKLEEGFEFVMKVIKTLRSTKDSYVSSKTKVEASIFCNTDESYVLVDLFKDSIITLSNLLKINIFKASSQNSGKLSADSIVDSTCKISVIIDGLVDPNKEIEKLTSQKVKLEECLHSVNNTIKNFDKCVPSEVVDKTVKKHADLTTQIHDITETIEKFQSFSISS